MIFLNVFGLLKYRTFGFGTLHYKGHLKMSRDFGGNIKKILFINPYLYVGGLACVRAYVRACVRACVRKTSRVSKHRVE